MTKLPEPPQAASTETMSAVGSRQSAYEQLEAAAEQLRKSERGAAALKNLSNFFREGGTGLDDRNKRAALALFVASLNNPWDLPANLTNGGAS